MARGQASSATTTSDGQDWKHKHGRQGGGSSTTGRNSILAQANGGLSLAAWPDGKRPTCARQWPRGGNQQHTANNLGYWHVTTRWVILCNLPRNCAFECWLCLFKFHSWADFLLTLQEIHKWNPSFNESLLLQDAHVVVKRFQAMKFRKGHLPRSN